MRDREVVASIVAGEPAGLAAAYDKYADALYGYARSFLREPADAADVVHDTFVIAAASLSQLRDPERLRPWLYAVARSLCLRRLRADKAAAIYVAPEDIPEGAGEDSDELGGDAERAELRALLRAAGGGLNPSERDIVELRLWQGLDAAEAAAVLGITRGHAHALLSRGRDQLTASLAALLVARTGRADCAELDRVLSGWDGQLTVLMRKRLSRHIERCDICSDRRQRELRPALLVLWPAGLLAGAALAERAMHAASVPAALRAQVLQAASGPDVHAAASTAGLGSQVRIVRQNGFPQPSAPRPLALSRAVLRRGTHSHVTLWSAAAAAAALVGAGVFVWAHFLGHPGKSPGSAAGLGRPVTSSGPGTGGAAPPAGRRGPGRSGSGGTGGSAGRSGGGAGGRVVPVVTQKSGRTTPSAGGSLAAAGGAPSSSSPGAPASSAPAAAPSTAPASSAPEPSSSSPAPSSAAGTLTVSPTTVVLTPLLGSTLTLTAENGPVSWSISEPGSLLGELNVSPASGTLAAGQSVQVPISVSGLASLDTTLTVNPGGQAVTVVLGLGL
jgi:RNA polymerase sigma factor (sigma-70 family)